MTRKAPLPPELGGPLSKEEWIDAIHRADSAKFYRDVKQAAGEASAADQARILRHLANEIERHSGGNPVQRSQDRVKERESFPNRTFFQRGPVKPSEEMRRRWIDDHRARHGKPPMQWGPLLTKPEPRPAPTPAEQAAQLKARADDVKPMRFFSDRFRQKAAERPAVYQLRSDQERDR